MDRAMRTVTPSDATSAKDPSMARTAAGSPLNTRARAWSTLRFVNLFSDGSSRSTTRDTYDIVVTFVLRRAASGRLAAACVREHMPHAVEELPHDGRRFVLAPRDAHIERRIRIGQGHH